MQRLGSIYTCGSRRSQAEDDDEEALRWAALESLPAYDRLAGAFFVQTPATSTTSMSPLSLFTTASSCSTAFSTSPTTIGEDSKCSRQDKAELGRSFQSVVSSHDWALAESLIPLADTQRLNDALCIALDSIWFLSTQQELAGVTKLIEKLIRSGAHDFTRPTLRTSFLASCVSACRSRMMNLADTVTLMAQRIGGSGMDIRSKARTLSGPISDPKDLPKWNYDRSSTGQAPEKDSEVIL